MEPRRLDAYFFAKAFTLAYAFCYITAPIGGLYIDKMGVGLSYAVLVAIGIGLIMAVRVNNASFIIFMAVFQALGCVVHFYEVLPWIPRLTTNGYLLMSMLDLAQCVLLLIILEYKKMENTGASVKIAIKDTLRDG